ncbi:MAG TPA: tetratricopeptide repeat protein [Bacteroidia bacterium]|jgi:tetratricopeptide (TPR) repeat protein
MKRIPLIAALTLVFCWQSKACLNYYYFVNKEGNYYMSDTIIRAFNLNFNKERNLTKLKNSYSRLSREHDYRILSDYSVSLLKLGKTKTALELLIALERVHPEEYNIAANLGTAYELSAMPDSALKYIRLALKINPASHGNSEWVHIKVLETKLQMTINPKYLADHSVLRLTESQKKDSTTRKQIEVQVRERFPFCKGPDPVMASLLTDLGESYCNQLSVEYGKAMYQIAQKYYGDTTEALTMKIKEAQLYINKYADKKIEIPVNRRMEASYDKIGYFSYKQLLDDNDPGNYVVDWTGINLDIKTLLSLAKIN